MDFTNWIGSVAAFLTTSAFLPQAIHSWRTRDLSGISLPMYSMFSLGVACWFIYGLLIWSWPIMIANGVTLFLAVVVLSLKLKYT